MESEEDAVAGPSMQDADLPPFQSIDDIGVVDSNDLPELCWQLAGYHSNSGSLHAQMPVE